MQGRRSPILFTFNTAYEYEFKTIEAMIGTCHARLIDKTNNITYIIDRSAIMFPIFVYGNELFMPTEYNVHVVVRNRGFEVLNFTRYSLTNHSRRARKVHNK